MNEIEVKKLKDKIIKCDLTIHIQQLGTLWEEPPSEEQKELTNEKSKQQASTT